MCGVHSTKRTPLCVCVKNLDGRHQLCKVQSLGGTENDHCDTAVGWNPGKEKKPLYFQFEHFPPLNSDHTV